MAEAEAGASEGDITEDQVCAAIDATWQQLRNPKRDDERTVKEMAKAWGISPRTANRRLEEMVEAGMITKRLENVEGNMMNLYRLLNGKE